MSFCRHLYTSGPKLKELVLKDIDQGMFNMKVITETVIVDELSKDKSL